MALYAQVRPEPLVRLLFFALMLLSLCVRKGKTPLRRREGACLCLFSLAFSVSLVLGYHIVIEDGRGYQNLSTQSYIAPYGALDAAALPLLTAGTYLVASALFLVVKGGFSRLGTIGLAVARPLERIGACRVAGVAALIFAAWVPYLLVYWPGFLFADSYSSICQAMGLEEWSNHHPVAYTLAVKLCLDLGNALGVGATGGCAIYSIFQMITLAACFSYLCNWIPCRLGLPRWWALAIAAALCLTPHIAAYGIAMWKDPLFSAAIVVATLLAADLVMSGGDAAKSRRWVLAFALALLVVAFFRSNGVFVVVVLLAALLGALAMSKGDGRQRFGLKAAGGAAAVVVAIALVVTGPAYAALGIKSDAKVEGSSILVNQMARVVVCDGDMTESDREYMDRMLPLELYAEAYHPCSVDSLKWHESFDGSVLDEGLAQHWLSMLLRNPRTFFEAWELQTCGFWAVNVPALNERTANIAAGVPVNTTGNLEEEYSALGIRAQNLLGNDALRDVFPQDEPAAPAGALAWATLYLALCAVLLGRPRWLIALAPSLGLALSLVIASPIWHAPRYAAAEYFLVPFYISLFLILSLESHVKKPEPRRKEHP